ncbi:MAG: histidine phosphatase family protein [Rhodobacteraceae bacterium]|nr:histidine phosphatase family protein [Paracoccaceae bacterium]
MSRLWLVRHGPTGGKAMYGWTDIPADLSDSAALTRLSAALPAGLPVISSDLIRARATADAIAGHRPRLPDDPNLREIHFGDWEGAGFAEIWARSPRLAQRLWDAPGDTYPPGGESWNALRTRVGTGIDRLLRDNPGGLIVVAHFGSILTQVQRATGETAKQVFGRKLRHLSLTEISTGPAWTLARFNELP